MRSLFIPVFVLFLLATASCEKSRKHEFYCDFPPRIVNLGSFILIPRDSSGVNLINSKYYKAEDITVVESCTGTKGRADTAGEGIRIYADVVKGPIVCQILYLKWNDSDTDTLSFASSNEQVGCGRQNVLKDLSFNGQKLTPDTINYGHYILTLKK